MAKFFSAYDVRKLILERPERCLNLYLVRARLVSIPWPKLWEVDVAIKMFRQLSLITPAIIFASYFSGIALKTCSRGQHQNGFAVNARTALSHVKWAADHWGSFTPVMLFHQTSHLLLNVTIERSLMTRASEVFSLGNTTRNGRDSLSCMTFTMFNSMP